MFKKVGILIIIIVVAAVLIALGVIWIPRKKNADKLSTSKYSVKFPKLSEFKLSYILNLPVTITYKIANFSPITYTINQVKIDLFDNSGNLLVEQLNTLPAPVSIAPAEINTKDFAFQYNINTTKLFRFVMNKAYTVDDATQLIKDILQNGKIGRTMQMKGFVYVFNAKDVKIDEAVTI